ncbi:hypothetical protein [Rhizobium sp. 18055]|jgi:hypothetical protein|uniref:hypothetical protein n=1 Tax=Rhizobium sp. 18055 TaxID=2681403 RepID=UPI001356E1D2|nr:hypothetical protein [Rhizobium sp. 18055]
MIASELAVDSPLPTLGGTDVGDAFLPMDLLELELSLESYDGDANFCDAVRMAARRSGGEFLFDLPAEGLLDDCKRIAVLRIPSASSDMRIVLAVLDHNGTDIRMESPAPETAHIVQFADAFIEVLERF